MATDGGSEAIPRESFLRLFLRFLRFGALAWGGPVAQIGMIRQELVEEECWVSKEQFNRVLAVYQVLPGPEAHELCVYFGYRSRGRIGGMIAGLGFMLPGFILMLILSWLYVSHGVKLASLAGVFAAVQAVVAALIVRAVIRIGTHVVVDRWLWAIAILAMAAQLAGVHFAFVLLGAGLIYVLALPKSRIAAVTACLVAVAVIGILIARDGFGGFNALSTLTADAGARAHNLSMPVLFWSGLKAGLLTFGGAYTVIPFLQRDAVAQGAWMSNAQFLDGLALSGLLPAPLVIFATFVGYLGGGPWGAVAMTAGVFLPAFAFTLLGHELLESLLHRPRVHRFLEGLTAGVVGLIAGTTLALMRTSLNSVEAWVLFALALTVLFVTKARLAVPALILVAAAWGWWSP